MFYHVGLSFPRVIPSRLEADDGVTWVLSLEIECILLDKWDIDHCHTKCG